MAMNSLIVKIIIIIVTIVEIKSIGRQVSSRDWPEDEREYEIIDPYQSDSPVKPSIPTRPNRPQTPTNTDVWKCDFEVDDCGIINDPMVGSYFKLISNPVQPLSGKRHYLLMNITNSKPLSSGARLITPYFQTKNYLKGCLIIDYMISGNAVNEALVYQQETENRCVWSGGGVGVAPDVWHKLSLTIDLTYGSPRYFIQFHLDNRPPNVGFVAISGIKFNYYICPKNDANNCGQHTDMAADEPNTITDYPNDWP